uniref:Uncharacterized protein n=1 Tax=Anguilla anguilla TaxID=7936 RepID=A0A0E9R6L8_ANGAN
MLGFVIGGAWSIRTECKCWKQQTASGRISFS